jgi:hypothetical protein
MTPTASQTPARGTLFALGLAAVLFLTPALCSAIEMEITIRIAPETLNLRSEGTVVTVHTDVPYSDIDVYSVYLSGVPIKSWKADDQGNFVAKFSMDSVKAIDGLVLNDYNELKFVAVTLHDVVVWGEADVMVIDRGFDNERPSARRRAPSDE